MNTSNWFRRSLPLVARLALWSLLVFFIIVSVPVSGAQSEYLRLGLSDVSICSLRLFTFSGQPYYSMVHEEFFTEDVQVLEELTSQLDRQYPADEPEGQPLCWGEMALSDGRIISMEVYSDTVVLQHGLAVMRCGLPAELFLSVHPEAGSEPSGE